MGLLDQVDETEKQPYKFASSGFDEYLQDLKRPKQQQDINEDQILNELETSDKEPEADQLETLKANDDVALSTGKLISMAIDGGLSSVLGFVAKEEPEKFQASQNERVTLENALTEFIKLKGADIPPGLALVIVIISIYAPKTITAIQLRHANEHIKELEDENRKLRIKTKDETQEDE